MADGLVYQAPVVGPATHAIVIGVGAYPHLEGGDGELFEDYEGMGQLTSPPLSAIAFAAWVRDEFRNPSRPLGSLRLLVSAGQPQVWRGANLEPATMANIDQAIRAWFADGNGDPENQLVFYFCGHGIGGATMLSLLASDYGANPENPFAAAIDFTLFRNAMNRCAAGYQCFFVDACQTNSLIALRADNHGASFFRTDRWFEEPKQQPSFYSTVHGEAAAARPGEATFFTKALIDGLQGGGGDRANGEWTVTTTMLQRSINAFLKREQRRQRPFADELSDFVVHHLERTPRVHVTVECRHPIDPIAAALSCESRPDPAVVHARPPMREPWSLELDAGVYLFTAHHAESREMLAECDEYVAPPERLVRLVRR